MVYSCEILVARHDAELQEISCDSGLELVDLGLFLRGFDSLEICNNGTRFV